MAEKSRDLSARQLQVLQIKTEVEGTKAVGKRLKIAANTARTHLHLARNKLGTSGTFQTIVKAAEAKLIDLNSSFSPDQFDRLNDLSPGQFATLRASIGLDGRLKTVEEVAEDLHRSPSTIKVQRERVRNRMGVGIALAGLILVTALASGYEYQRRKKNTKTIS